MKSLKVCRVLEKLRKCGSRVWWWGWFLFFEWKWYDVSGGSRHEWVSEINWCWCCVHVMGKTVKKDDLSKRLRWIRGQITGPKLTNKQDLKTSIVSAFSKNNIYYNFLLKKCPKMFLKTCVHFCFSSGIKKRMIYFQHYILSAGTSCFQLC